MAPDANSGATIFGFPKYPPFRLGATRFPQDTFKGRYLHYLDVVDPRTLFTSEKRLRECVALLDSYSKGGARGVSDRELWQAQKIKQAILHPDTGEKVLPPFRMSGFVPFGWITVTIMLLPNPSWPMIIFGQWLNQSHNACVNYANRNASKPQPVSKFVTAYASAVTSAVAIATGLTILVKKSDKLPAAKRMIIQRFVPLPATALASSVNVICMRFNEIEEGIEVYDQHKNVVGTSNIAAKQAVMDTTLTRAFLPIPLLLAPPCIMPFLERTKFVQKSAFRHLLVNAVVCTISFALTLPVALALFPQESTIETQKLEPAIQKATREKQLFYNRGL